MIEKINCDITLEAFRRFYYDTALDADYSFLMDSCGAGTFYVAGFGANSTITFANKSLLYTKNNRVIENKIASFTQLKQLLTYHQQKLNERYDSDLLSSYDDLPFISGWVGALSYELAEWIEPSISPREEAKQAPLIQLFEPLHTIAWRPSEKSIYIISDDESWVTNASKALAALEKIELNSKKEINTTFKFTPQSNYEAFESQVKIIHEHILQGDIYQANLSIPFVSETLLSIPDCLNLYDTLVNINPSPFSGLFITPVNKIISNSPERLIQYNANNNTLQALPIAGTRGRGKTPEEDKAIGDTLLNNTKECAEHLMLLDLLRNDLGRVAEPASVSVPKSFFLERYSHVTHLVSEVIAQKQPALTIWDVIESVFPGGTITGCPKVRCMEILAETEATARGFYTGSLGYIDARGHSDWNILIRSLFYDNRRDELTAQFGAGIVADSVAENEYKECYRKFAALEQALTSLQPTIESKA